MGGSSDLVIEVGGEEVRLIDPYARTLDTNEMSG